MSSVHGAASGNPNDDLYHFFQQELTSAKSPKESREAIVQAFIKSTAPDRVKILHIAFINILFPKEETHIARDILDEIQAKTKSQLAAGESDELSLLLEKVDSYAASRLSRILGNQPPWLYIEDDAEGKSSLPTRIGKEQAEEKRLKLIELIKTEKDKSVQGKALKELEEISKSECYNQKELARNAIRVRDLRNRFLSL